MLDLERLLIARKNAGLTQDAAAKESGLASRQVWNNIERGRTDVTIGTLDRIAAALGVEPAALLVPVKAKKSAKK